MISNKLYDVKSYNHTTYAQHCIDQGRKPLKIMKSVFFLIIINNFELFIKIYTLITRNTLDYM